MSESEPMGEKPAEQIFWSAVGAYRWGRVGDSLKLFEMDERENLASSSQIGKVAKSPICRSLARLFFPSSGGHGTAEPYRPNTTGGGRETERKGERWRRRARRGGRSSGSSSPSGSSQHWVRNIYCTVCRLLECKDRLLFVALQRQSPT